MVRNSPTPQEISTAQSHCGAPCPQSHSCRWLHPVHSNTGRSQTWWMSRGIHTCSDQKLFWQSQCGCMIQFCPLCWSIENKMICYTVVSHSLYIVWANFPGFNYLLHFIFILLSCAMTWYVPYLTWSLAAFADTQTAMLYWLLETPKLQNFKHKIYNYSTYCLHSRLHKMLQVPFEAEILLHLQNIFTSIHV